MALKPEYKTPWLEALRSGKFQQTQGRLKVITHIDNNTPKYCCLGVLVEVCFPDRFVKSNEYSRVFQLNVPPYINSQVNSLTVDILDEIGLTSVEQGCLITANDGDSCNFSEIADMIENM